MCLAWVCTNQEKIMNTYQLVINRPSREEKLGRFEQPKTPGEPPGYIF